MLILKLSHRTKPLLFALGLSLFLPGITWAKPGQLSLSLDVLGALPSLYIASGANQGLGLECSADYRLSDAFAFGLTGGMIEFIAPTGKQDFKTVWLDLMRRLDDKFRP